MSQKADFLFKEPGIYIEGSLGPEYRRLKLLELLTKMEEIVDSKEDKVEYETLLRLREKLQEAPSGHTVDVGISEKYYIPFEEDEVTTFMETFTDYGLEWRWSDGDLILAEGILAA